MMKAMIFDLERTFFVQKKKTKSQISMRKFILIFITTIFSFTSLTTAVFLMGVKAIPWFIFTALFYFIPFAFIIAEFTGTYKEAHGGLYNWLKDALSEQTAFIALFLWYCSYFIWAISLFMKLWIPLSIMLFGKDISQAKGTFLSLSYNTWIVILALSAIFLVTFLINRGFLQIANCMFLSGILLLILVVISFSSNIFLTFTHPMATTISNLSIHEQPQSFWQQFSFLIFAITSFGGMDTVSSLVDKAGTNKNKFPRIIFISAIAIVVLYLSGVLLWSTGGSLQYFNQTEATHLGNLSYGLMAALATKLAVTFQLAPATTQLLVQVFIRLTAFTMFLSYIGLLVSISYTPLKAIVEGTSKHFLPDWLREKNKVGIVYRATWLQAACFACFVLFIRLLSAKPDFWYNQLTLMTNISRSIPYFLIACAFPFYRKKQLEAKSTQFLKRPWQIYFVSLSVMSLVLIAISFQVVEPFVNQQYLDCLSLAGGPILFSLLGLLLFKSYQRRKNQLLEQ